MGARDYQRTSAANEFFLEDFRQRAVKHPAIEHSFDFGIATRNRVPDHHAIRRRIEMRHVVPLHQADADSLQHRGHRRIHIFIGARDPMTTRLQHSRQRGHRGAADSNQVIMHLFFLDLRAIHDWEATAGRGNFANMSWRKTSSPSRAAQPNSLRARLGST